MGIVNRIAAGVDEIPFANRTELRQAYNSAFHEALYQLDPIDRSRVMDIIHEYAPVSGKQSKIRQFGTRGMLELLGCLGIFLASLPEKDFKLVLASRGKR
jgi:hypothetical protein